MSFKRKFARKDNEHVGKDAFLFGNRFDRRGYKRGMSGTKIKRGYKMRTIAKQDYCPILKPRRYAVETKQIAPAENSAY